MNHGMSQLPPASASDIYGEIYKRAIEAAKKAIEDFGPEDTKSFNCGFAWVQVTPATHPFIRWCKARGYGDKHWKRGWNFSHPGDAPVQQVDIHYAGAKAFAMVLERSLEDCVVLVGSRLD